MQTDPRQTIQAAIAHHQAGRLAEAEGLYREVLARAPGHPDALHMLGLLAHQQGQQRVAEDLIRQAIRVVPKHAACHSNLGNVLKAQGRLDEAIRSYRKALALSPSFADAHQNLGIALQAKGLAEDAVTSLRRAVALAPGNAGAHYNLGHALLAAGRHEEALQAYGQAVALQPGFAEAHNSLGNVHHLQGRPREAEACYARALELKPDFAEAQNNIGLVLAARQGPDEAMPAFRRALEMNPGYAEAWQNLGAQHQAKGDPEAALACYRRAVDLKPGLATAWNNIGNALAETGAAEEARAAYEKALALDPAAAGAWNNLGNLLQSMGRLDEALACADRALAIDPGSADAHWNKSFALLLKGDFEAGWALAEWRWRFNDPSRARRRFDSAHWLGESPVAGKRMLLHHEQGLGDTLQMLRYAPLLADRGAEVAVLVPRSLAAVAATVPGVAAVVTEDAPPPAFDLHCPFMSLPLAFGTTLASVPASVPYVSAAGQRREAWRARLGPRRRARVGLAWSGAAAHRNDRQRSIALARLAPLLDLVADFVSLQKEYRPADAAWLQADGRIRDVAADLGDFADTAALLDELDLVISVDTSVVHLAGAMARPAWLLLPHGPDYRWLLDRDDSPWYPTLRLFRQPAPGDWDTVIARVAQALARFSPASP